MLTEKTTEYQSWFQSEMEFAKGVRRRKRAVFLKCIAITLVVAVLAGAVGDCGVTVAAQSSSKPYLQ